LIVFGGERNEHAMLTEFAKYLISSAAAAVTGPSWKPAEHARSLRGAQAPASVAPRGSDLVIIGEDSANVVRALELAADDERQQIVSDAGQADEVDHAHRKVKLEAFCDDIKALKGRLRS
jgi:hypothetical protein